MKKTLQLILIVIGLTSCEAQEVSGIWMSYQNYVIDPNSMFISGNEGVLIDFDKETIGTIHSDSIVDINIDFEQSKLFMQSDTLNVEFKGKDSIEIDFGQNMMHVFRRLNLTEKLTIDKKEITDFLVQNNFENSKETIDIEFSDKLFFRDVMFEKPEKRNTLINKSWDDEGYWFVKEIERNFFLIFALDQTSDQNIYQILSLDSCKMELLLLQEAEFGSTRITELKTCL